ncbi:MAG TPA: hypothetical protein VJK49_05810 [Candidatus Limnocylindrales bacterium]|nr:hypothetical protein [Candidatus Limnocylindrales bacterium]
MARLVRADLEALLRTRQLDVTLTTVRPWLEDGTGQPDRVIPTGLPAFDGRLGGGVPRGQVSAVAGAASSGRTSLVCALLAQVTAEGETAALVDARDRFDPPSAAAAGIEFSRLLWIRGGPVASADSRQSTLERQVNRAVKALTLVLQAGPFGLAVLDLADVPEPAVRALPFTTWLRLGRLVEGTRTACVVVGTRPIARSAGGLTITLESGREVSAWSGTSDRTRLFRGLCPALRQVGARRAS